MGDITEARKYIEQNQRPEWNPSQRARTIVGFGAGPDHMKKYLDELKKQAEIIKKQTELWEAANRTIREYEEEIEKSKDRLGTSINRIAELFGDDDSSVFANLSRLSSGAFEMFRIMENFEQFDPDNMGGNFVSSASGSGIDTATSIATSIALFGETMPKVGNLLSDAATALFGSSKGLNDASSELRQAAANIAQQFLGSDTGFIELKRDVLGPLIGKFDEILAEKGGK